VPDLRRVSILAVLLLVVLRISIGWQLLYEGLWKIQTLNTSRPWSAEGYLKNAVGPFRDHFRNMTGDPDDLNWLDHDKVAADWDAWHGRFASHYALTEQQQRELDSLINGPKTFEVPLSALPEGVDFRGSVGASVSYDSKRKRLVVDGARHLLPVERDALKRKVAVAVDPAPEDREQNKLAREFQKAVDDVFRRAQRLSFKERLAVLLKGDPERLGADYVEQDGRVYQISKGQESPGESAIVLEERLGKVDLYRSLLRRYEDAHKRAKQNFEFAHLNRQWEELQELRQELVGPVKALDDDLNATAKALLSTEQLSRGPMRPAWTPMHRINMLTIGGLTILGLLLIVGLCTRFAAVAGAVMLFSFYLAAPPFPGVPDMGGPEHSLIVNKNLIEVIALLAIAALPTGTWFGMDAIFYRLFGSWKRRRNAAA
jgi:uncharacterized membrane protein YphA (DoxX/SURF4 family)